MLYNQELRKEMEDIEEFSNLRASSGRLRQVRKHRAGWRLNTHHQSSLYLGHCLGILGIIKWFQHSTELLRALVSTFLGMLWEIMLGLSLPDWGHSLNGLQLLRNPIHSYHLRCYDKFCCPILRGI